MNLLADLITLVALACGFISIIFSLESHFILAAWAIILSVIFDGLDGQIARMNPAPSKFGKELDSLADVISFGVAPAILGYVFIYRDFYFWAIAALFIYLACSVLRLAKYNITPKEKLTNYFFGLPTTASGGMIASFILLYRRQIELSSPPAFLFLILVLASLMVSKVKYLNLDALKQLLVGRSAIFFIIMVLAGLIFRPQLTIFLLFAAYIVLAPFWVKRVVKTA